jgi:rubrerythrin
VVGAPRRATSRRAFLRGAGLTVAASPIFIAGCGDDTPPAPTRTGPPDADVLNAMLDLEYTAVAAYRGAMPVLQGETLRTARHFLPQEEAHAAALAKAVHELGARPSRPKRKYPPLATQNAFLRYAVTLENAMIAAYLDALTKVSDRALRAEMGAILTAEAGHISVFADILDADQSPNAFVTGHPS